MENEQLYHHGVLGMKWGIRRYQNKDGTLTPAGKKRYDRELEKLKAEQKVLKNKQRTQAKLDKLSAMRKEIDDQKRGMEPEEVKAKKSGAKGLHRAKKLSTDELNERISRMKLEKEYKTLASETDTINSGKKLVFDVLKKVGKDALEQTVAYAVETGINKILFKGEDAIDPKNIQNRRKK